MEISNDRFRDEVVVDKSEKGCHFFDAHNQIQMFGINMAELRKKLIDKLEKIPGIDVHLWKPDRDFMVIDYNGKEVAHFHGNNELDVRLSPKVVKREGLTHAPDRVGHPNRKNGGTWLIARFTREDHLAEMVRLVKMAIELR